MAAMNKWEPPSVEVPLQPNEPSPKWWRHRYRAVPVWGWIVGGVVGLIAVSAIAAPPEEDSIDVGAANSAVITVLPTDPAATTTTFAAATTVTIAPSTTVTTIATPVTTITTTTVAPTLPPTTVPAPATTITIPLTLPPTTTTTAPPAPPATTLPPPPPTTTIAILPLIPQNTCDPNYSGACVPIASDVDCAGGSGNGPAYVQGPVYIVGSDIYDLDGNDNDGVGCEG
jgi:hypothetical protein